MAATPIQLAFLVRTAVMSHTAGVKGFTRDEVRVKLLELAPLAEVEEALKAYDNPPTPREVGARIESLGRMFEQLKPELEAGNGRAVDAHGLDESDRIVISVFEAATDDSGVKS